MAYGRLDVFWPDGKFESYTIDQPVVSIGRASDNTISLDSESISRYHFSIIHKRNQIQIADMDSANGTYVDGIRLKSDEPYDARGVEEIQAGELRIIFRPIDESPTIPIISSDDTRQISPQEDIDFTIGLDTLALDVWPASSNSVQLSVTNSGLKDRIFFVQPEGLPGEWLSISRARLALSPEETGYVLVNIKPVRRSDTKPGLYALKLRVSPQETPDAGLEGEVRVNVHGYKGFSVALEPYYLDVSDTLQIFLLNQGNELLQVSMVGHDRSDKLIFALPTEPLNLAPGQRLRVTGSARPRKRRLTGAPGDHSFDIIVHSLDAAQFVAAIRGKIRLAPLVPLWGVITAAGILLSVIMIFLFGFADQFQPQPVILNFTVSEKEIAQGEQITLRWEARDAEKYNIFIDDVLMFRNLDGDLSGNQLILSTYTGNVKISLQAINGNKQATASAELVVYAPMELQYFAIEPMQLVRNVRETLTIRWNVAGASSARIRGVENFAGEPVDARLEELGALEYTGFPAESFTITLLAENAFGDGLSSFLDISVIDPICATTGSVALLEGPDPRNQVIATIPADISVIVDGRDTTGKWIRILLDGGVKGWANRAMLECSERFNPDNLRIALDVPPTPEITPTPQGTATEAASTTPLPVTVSPETTEESDPGES